MQHKADYVQIWFKSIKKLLADGPEIQSTARLAAFI